MIRTMGWEKRLLITFIITLFLFFIIQAPSIAFGPSIVDVTTKAFSVVWTTGGPYTSCGIKLYTNGNYNIERTDIDSSQIIIETGPGQPGEDGKQYGIAKVTVVGLDVGAQYFFGITQNGGAPFFKRSVTTENLRGMNSNDPNDNDIVSNDVVHKAVYEKYAKDGTSPALGALVLAEIYSNDADVYTNTPLSDYPISAWVGDGMIGDEDSSEYNPDNISYKQYAAINMNNLFGTDHFPLSLKGDNPDTPTENESEKIKFTIVHGTLEVFGQDEGEDHFTSVGRVESIDKANNDKITTAKVSVSFNFETGLNSFTFPFNPTKEYKTGELLEAIESAGGQPITIYTFKGTWIPTVRLSPTKIFNNIIIGEGDACIINMNNSINKENELSFYGKPLSSKIELFSGINIFSIPQCPSLYKTENMWLDIEALEGVSAVIAIHSFLNPWSTTVRISLTRFYNSLFMKSSRIYAVVLELKPGVTSVLWDPFPNN